MATWEKKLEEMEGLTWKQKQFLTGKLLAVGDSRADRYFMADSKEDTMDRVHALLPPDGERCSACHVSAACSVYCLSIAVSSQLDL